MRTYVTHYFNFEYIGIYLLVSLIGLAVVIGIVLGVAKLKTRQRLQDDSLSHKAIRRINRHHQERKRSIIESFFEMVFASTSVLIFLSLYYVIDERFQACPSIGRSIRILSFYSSFASPLS